MRLLFSALIVTFFAGAAHAEGPLRSDVKRDPVYPPAAAVAPAPVAAAPVSVVPAAPAAYSPALPAAAAPAYPIPNATAVTTIATIPNAVPAVAAPVAAAPAQATGYAPTSQKPAPAAYSPATAAPVTAPAPVPAVAAPVAAKPADAIEEVGYDPKVKRDPKGRPVGGSHINPNGNLKAAPASMPMGRSSDASPRKDTTTASRPSPSSSALTKAMNGASKNPKMDDSTRSMEMSSQVSSRQSEKKLSKMMGQADTNSKSYSSNLNLSNSNNGAGSMSMGSGMGTKSATRKISIPRSAIPSGGRRSVASSNYNNGSSRNFTMPRSRTVSPNMGRTNVGRNYFSPARSSFRTANNY